MTQSKNTVELQGLLDKAQSLEGFDLYRELVQSVVQALLEAERDQHIGAARYERGEHRADTRSGYKPRTLVTPVGTLQLQKPQTRCGMKSQILNDYERVDQAILTTAHEMYVNGVSTRKVEKLLEDTIGSDISPTTVSKANKRLDEQVTALKQRELGEFVILLVDARFDKVRQDGAIRSAAFLTIYGIDTQGYRHVLDFAAVTGETKHHWKTLFERMKARGLRGVRWMVSDDHAGLREALCETFVGAVWQRCQTHITRNVMGQTASKNKREMAARLEDVFQAPTQEMAQSRLKELAKWAEGEKKGLGDYIEEVVVQGLSVLILPQKLRRRLRTTNLPERINQELKRRTRVVRIFPSLESYERLAGSILVQLENKWEEQGRRYLDAQLLIETLDEKFGQIEGRED